jgi:hypothetical protein
MIDALTNGAFIIAAAGGIVALISTKSVWFRTIGTLLLGFCSAFGIVCLGIAKLF